MDNKTVLENLCYYDIRNPDCCFDDEEIEKIFANYYLEYRDRGIVGSVYSDSEELGKEEAEHYIQDFENVRTYFDYEAFAGDLLQDDGYIELSNEKCVRLNY